MLSQGCWNPVYSARTNLSANLPKEFLLRAMARYSKFRLLAESAIDAGEAVRKMLNSFYYIGASQEEREKCNRDMHMAGKASIRGATLVRRDSGKIAYDEWD